MTTKPVVFLGPSLPRADAELILAADYRPPIRRGDLSNPRAAHTVLIVDGEFNQNLSVSPKEIMALLEHGINIMGAASMGALRALELLPYGMKGCGWVFEAYRSQRITADDEVAVFYRPIDMYPVTLPLVNLRYWLDGLLARRKIDRSSARHLLARMRRIFFAERTLERLIEVVADVAPEISSECQSLRPYGESDVKAADTRLALAEVGAAEGTQ